ncbi:MAG: lipopolysaccharide heptosyltransferase II [Parachlamydiales bacterium]|nr:lipopolysaccharide heptosyltransferase II [Parachlamydiales bacterium]
MNLVLATDFKNIIIRMPNWVGDLVMAMPILQKVRQRFPHARITAMCLDTISSLLEKDPHIDEIFSFRKEDGQFLRQENRDVVMTLRKGGYDLGILLTNSFSSAWLFWQGKVAYRLGYAAFGRTWLLNIPVAYPKTRKSQHLVLTYQQLLHPLGISSSSTRPKIYLDKEEIEQAKALLYDKGYPKQKFLLGINADAAYGETKRWPQERFRELAQQLLEIYPDLYILFFGDQSSVPRIKAITSGLSKRAINLAGLTTLRELAGLIFCLDLLVTNDSGPMHMASALDIPVVALFGSTSELVTGPVGEAIVIKKPLRCSPCFKRRCKKNIVCMRSISTQEVLNIIQKKIDEKNSATNIA